MCDRFFIVAFDKLIVAFVNAFVIWPIKGKKKKTIATFLKRGYRQIQKKYSRGCSRVLNAAIGHRYGHI